MAASLYFLELSQLRGRFLRNDDLLLVLLASVGEGFWLIQKKDLSSGPLAPLLPWPPSSLSSSSPLSIRGSRMHQRYEGKAPPFESVIDLLQRNVSKSIGA